MGKRIRVFDITSKLTHFFALIKRIKNLGLNFQRSMSFLIAKINEFDLQSQTAFLFDAIFKKLTLACRFYSSSRFGDNNSN